MTIREVLQFTSPTLIRATRVVAPIRVVLQLSTHKIRDVLQVTCRTSLIVVELPNKLYSTERQSFYAKYKMAAL